MLVFDDTAAAALHAATAEARRLGRTKYETAHVLLGLLAMADPVSRQVAGEHPQLTIDAARRTASSPSASNVRPVISGHGVHDAVTKPVPSPEFRRAAQRFTGKWRPLARGRQLQLNRKLGTAELWLIVLEPETASAGVVTSLGADPEAIRRVVLAALVPDGTPLPAWPRDVPTGPFQRLLHLGTRLGTFDGRAYLP